MKRVMLLLSVLVVACGDAVDPQITEAEDAVRYILKDPDSAKFRNVRVVDRRNRQPIVCGEVNSKNSYGGYTGFSPFKYEHKVVDLPDDDDYFEMKELERDCAKA